ncbi:hypothetical protein RCO28_37220 [Streptomyces sp. LHD-70]|uniref:hypothetical protein n=1 Tax=Streptomyces sp. LHD-70 TaxID=3072140 RepID=UPI0028104C1F|nr:hypothetical protein [Streptomyces sp. LHD-70]MDQ8708063.1 hypothetical protein [Streptomyces sp. LHD-70]
MAAVVCGALLVAVNGVLGFVTFAVGPWRSAEDAEALAVYRDLALAVLFGCALVAALTWVFVKARWLGLWWYALPGLLAVLSLIRVGMA